MVRPGWLQKAIGKWLNVSIPGFPHNFGLRVVPSPPNSPQPCLSSQGLSWTSDYTAVTPHVCRCCHSHHLRKLATQTQSYKGSWSDLQILPHTHPIRISGAWPKLRPALQDSDAGSRSRSGAVTHFQALPVWRRARGCPRGPPPQGHLLAFGPQMESTCP